jgi:degradative hydroxymethylglutaryl-CoA reductase
MLEAAAAISLATTNDAEAGNGEGALENRKFRKYSIRKRRDLMASDPGLALDADDFATTGHRSELLDLADVMVETAVGFMPVPLGIARNFIVDGRTVHLPMAVEEPSVIAAATFAAGIIGRHGGFETEADEPLLSSYVYLGFPAGSEPDEIAAGKICEAIIEAENRITDSFYEILQPMTRRGGGYRGLEASWLPASRSIRVEITIDVRDAHGGEPGQYCGRGRRTGPRGAQRRQEAYGDPEQSGGKTLRCGPVLPAGQCPAPGGIPRASSWRNASSGCGKSPTKTPPGR